MRTPGATARIAHQEWLKPVEEGLQNAIHKTFRSGGPAGKRVKNFLQGTWIGHPLHVILTDIPIGAWTAAMVFDLLDLIGDREQFSAAADTAVAIGLVSALGAAVTGLTDWQDIDPPARRIGLVHATLNVTGVGLFAASLLMRRKRSRAAGRVLALLGYTAMTAAARLGGKLVYEQRIGVDHTAGEALPDDFAPVLKDSDLLDGAAKRAMYNSTPILLVRRGADIFALAETCSHLGGPLSEGSLVDNTIQCPWHGSRFTLDSGKVVDGPAVHPQPCLETRVRDGRIEVRKYTAIKPTATVEKKATPRKKAEQREERTGTRG
jgi:nitrite reductase/ring-hydroxylating ferredoxin subunit/uncharacterized membrane protein